MKNGGSGRFGRMKGMKRIVEFLHTITLVISCCFRISIISAERIVVIVAQIYYFLGRRWKCTSRPWQVLEALLCLGIFPVEMKRDKLCQDFLMVEGGLKWRRGDKGWWEWWGWGLEKLGRQGDSIHFVNNNNNKLYLHGYNNVLQYWKSYMKLIIDSF